MPMVLAGIGAFIASLTVVEIIAIAAVVAVGMSVLTNRNMNGVAPQPPVQQQYSINPLTLTASNDAPRRIVYGKMRVSGVLAYWNISGEGHEYLTMVIVIAAHRIKEVSGLLFDGKPADDVASGFYDVTYYDGTQVAADPTLMATFPEWTANCKLLGLAYARVRLKFDRDVWSNGRPNVQFDIKGKNDIYDPRTGLYDWTNNAALCTADAIVSPDILGAEPEEVDWDYVAAGADIAEQMPDGMSASLCDGRYTIDGVVELTSRNGEIITQMLSACAGTLIWSEGKFKLFVGAVRPPVARPITREDFADDFSLQPMMAADQVFNGVKGTFLDATKNWTFTDFPPVLSAAHVTADGGVPIYKDIVFQFVTSPITAQRLATIFLRRARLEKSITLKCKWTCFNYEVWDIVPLYIPELAWEGKLFQIMDWRMTPPTRGEDTGGIELVLQEYDDAIYDDDMDLEPIVPPGTIGVPDVTIPAPVPVLFATTGPTVADSLGRPQVRFDWASSSDIYATGYEFAYGVYPFAPTDADYRFIPGRSSFSFTAGPFNPGDSVVGFIRVLNSFDKRSTVTESSPVVAQASIADFPEDVENLTHTLPNSEAVDLSWSAPDNPQGQVEVRWGPTNVLADASYITRFADGPTTVRLTRPATEGYYFVGFISVSGIYGNFDSTGPVAARTTGTILQTLTLNERDGDLTNGVWVTPTKVVSKSQRLASELDWEVFDLMVPEPYAQIKYFRKNATYVAGGELRASGSVGWSKAPGIPGTLGAVSASAEVAYFAETVYEQGQFELTADANVKIGFIANHSQPQGVVINAFNGTLEEV